MKDKNILEVEIHKKINCSKEVALWNYWDHEHLDVIHSGYKKSDILYDRDNFMFRVDKIKVPIVPFFKFNTPIFMVQHNDSTLFVYAVQMGVISKTTISVKALTKSSCEIMMNYKFYLNGWRKILKPFLKIMIPKWNEKVWLEDYPVKIRRQMVLDMNFKDFKGLPKEINSRKLEKNDNNNLFKLPIPRPKNSSRDLHPLSVRSEKQSTKK
jgi:hypothetical protein